MVAKEIDRAFERPLTHCRPRGPEAPVRSRRTAGVKREERETSEESGTKKKTGFSVLLGASLRDILYCKVQVRPRH